jgi:LCP family protein required for cell wall assembly
MTTHTPMQRRRKKRRKNTTLKTIRRFILILLIALLAYTGYLYITAKQAAENMYTPLEDQTTPEADGSFSALIIGVDQGGSRSTDGHGLSDALLHLTFNQETKKITLLSIPRDSYVYVPQRDHYTKITHAHAYGGPSYSLATVEHLLDSSIDYYAQVNFNVFVELVEALDGIYVDVPFEMEEMDSTDSHDAIHLLPGEQWLNGEEALALARTRKYDNDIERGKRQQMIFTAIFDRLTNPTTLFKLDNMMSGVSQETKTNMPFTVMQKTGLHLLTGGYTIERLNLTGQDLWTDAYYFELDQAQLNTVKTTIKQNLH